MGREKFPVMKNSMGKSKPSAAAILDIENYPYELSDQFIELNRFQKNSRSQANT